MRVSVGAADRGRSGWATARRASADSRRVSDNSRGVLAALARGGCAAVANADAAARIEAPFRRTEVGLESIAFDAALAGGGAIVNIFGVTRPGFGKSRPESGASGRGFNAGGRGWAMTGDVDLNEGTGFSGNGFTGNIFSGTAVAGTVLTGTVLPGRCVMLLLPGRQPADAPLDQ